MALEPSSAKFKGRPGRNLGFADGALENEKPAQSERLKCQAINKNQTALKAGGH